MSISDVSTIKFGRIHGEDDGGFLNDDSKDANLTISSYISSIAVMTSHNQLQSIKFHYSSVDSIEKQKSSIIFNVTQTNSNERIHRIDLSICSGVNTVKTHHFICGIQFHTTANRSSPFFGDERGQQHSSEQYSGFVLAYMRIGKQNRNRIQRIQFVWYKV